MNLSELTFDGPNGTCRVVGAFSPANNDMGLVGIVDEADPEGNPYYAKATELKRDGVALPDLPFIHNCPGPCNHNGKAVSIVGANHPLNVGRGSVQATLLEDDHGFEGGVEGYILQ